MFGALALARLALVLCWAFACAPVYGACGVLPAPRPCEVHTYFVAEREGDPAVWAHNKCGEFADVNLMIRGGIDDRAARELAGSSVGRISRREFTRANPTTGARHANMGDFRAAVATHGLNYGEITPGYRGVIEVARRMRDSLRAAGISSLSLRDSRQLATAYLRGERFLTADLTLFKRARDLGMDARFADINPPSTNPNKLTAVQKAEKYKPLNVVDWDQ